MPYPPITPRSPPTKMWIVHTPRFIAQFDSKKHAKQFIKNFCVLDNNEVRLTKGRKPLDTSHPCNQETTLPDEVRRQLSLANIPQREAVEVTYCSMAHGYRTSVITNSGLILIIIPGRKAYESTCYYSPELRNTLFISPPIALIPSEPPIGVSRNGHLMVLVNTDWETVPHYGRVVELGLVPELYKYRGYKQSEEDDDRNDPLRLITALIDTMQSLFRPKFEFNIDKVYVIFDNFGTLELRSVEVKNNEIVVSKPIATGIQRLNCLRRIGYEITRNIKNARVHQS